MGKSATISSRPRKALEEASSIVSNKKRPADDVFETTAKKAKKAQTALSANPPNFVYDITLPGEEDVKCRCYQVLSVGHYSSIRRLQHYSQKN